MIECFKPDCNLHKKFFQMSEEELINITTKHQDWRNDIKVGDQVDVHVKTINQKVSGWLQGTIDAIENDDINVVFPNSNREFDGQISRWSNFMMPFESMTKEDYEWRATLVGCDKEIEIDCHDDFTWKESTIMSSEEQKSGDRFFPVVEVGFRVYRTTGLYPKTDTDGRTFIGYSRT